MVVSFRASHIVALADSPARQRTRVPKLRVVKRVDPVRMKGSRSVTMSSYSSDSDGFPLCACCARPVHDGAVIRAGDICCSIDCALENGSTRGSV